MLKKYIKQFAEEICALDVVACGHVVVFLAGTDMERAMGWLQPPFCATSRESCSCCSRRTTVCAPWITVWDHPSTRMSSWPAERLGHCTVPVWRRTRRGRIGGSSFEDWRGWKRLLWRGQHRFVRSMSGATPSNGLACGGDGCVVRSSSVGLFGNCSSRRPHAHHKRMLNRMLQQHLRL